MANKYRYPLSNGRTLTLEGDIEPNTNQVEEIARQQGVSLKGLETPSARTKISTGTSDRKYIDEAQDFLSRNPYFKSPDVSTGPQNFEQPEDEGGGLLSKAYNAITTPLTHYLPTEMMDKAADWITTPRLNESPTSAMLKGFAGGALHGLGHIKEGAPDLSKLMEAGKDDSYWSAFGKGLVGGVGDASAQFTSAMTSPVDLIQTIAGTKIPGISPSTLRTIGKAASVPGMMHGGGKVIDPESTLMERGQGAFELAMNALGYKTAGPHEGVNTGPSNKTPEFDLPLHEAPPSELNLPLNRQPRGTPYDLPIRQPNTGFDLPLNPSNNTSRGLEYPLPSESNIPSDLPMGPRDEGPLLDLPLNQPSSPQGNDLPLQGGIQPEMDLPLRPGVNPQVSAPIANPPSWQNPDLQLGQGHRRISFNEPSAPEPTIQPTPVDNGPQASITNDPYTTLGNHLKQQRLNELIEKSKNGTLTPDELIEGNRLLGVTDGEPSQQGLPMDHPQAWGLSPLTEPSNLPPDNLSQGGLPFDRNFAPELGNTPAPEPSKPELTPQQKQARLDEIIAKAQEGPLSIEDFREGNALHQELSNTTDTVDFETGEVVGNKNIESTLPKGKIRYNTGKKSVTLNFKDDVDKSLLALGGKNDAAHLKYVMEKTGLDEAGAREAGKKIRAAVKEQLKGHEGGVAEIEPIHNKKNETIELEGDEGVASEAEPKAEELFSDAEDAAEGFTFGSYGLNGSLRSGGKLNPVQQSQVTQLDSKMAPIRDRVLYRGVDPEYASTLKEGTEFTDNGYTSTTRDYEHTRSYGNEDTGEHTIMIIDLPQGQTALDMGATFGDKASGHAEVVLPRGTRFRVKDTSDAELGSIRLEVVPETSTRQSTLAEDTGLSNDTQKTIELPEGGVSSMNWKDTRNLNKGEGTAKTTIDPDTGETIDLNTGEVIPPETTGNEPTSNNQIENALKLKGQLEDVKAKPPSGQERPTPSLAASLPVGANLTVSSKTFSPQVMKKLYEMGFDHSGMSDLGNHKFTKVSDKPRTAPVLETEVGNVRPKATPKKQEQTLIGEITNFSRSIMASLDMSAPLRQGIGLAHRKEFWNALPDMVKSWGSEAVYNGVMADINSRTMFQTRQGVGGKELPSFAEDAGLKLTNMYDLAAREESFMSNLAGKLPGVQRSERAYSAFLNKLRADTFESLIKSGKVFGADGEVNITMAREIANFVNTATGRGSLGSLEKSATALNNTFFAPRLIASRLQMLNPMTYVNASPPMRKEYLKSLFMIAGAGMGVGQLAKMAGAKVETDPTSSDYGKIRIGNTRIDPYAGFQQYAVAAKRLMPHWATIGKPTNTGILPLDLMTGFIGTSGGFTKSSTTNNKYELGASYGKPTKLDVAERFVEGKLNPVWSFATGMLKGKDFQGAPFNIPEEVASRVVPLIVQDIKELATEDPNLIPGLHRKSPYKEFHPENLPLAAPAFFGAGVQPYSNFK